MISSRVALQILLYGVHKDHILICRRRLYQVVSYSVLDRMITVLNMLCMLGRENGIIYVNIGYIFLTVLLGPAWDICNMIR